MNIKKFNLKQLNLNKTKILIITLIVTISVFLIGISYAYFQNQFGDDARSELEILSGTVDNLFFDIEKPLYINASVFNFGSGKGNIQDDTDATATLVPNNTTYEATASYNIYLVIEENELEYTTEEHTPELVFNVTDPNGNEVENITGLLHYENGFDITTRTGGFLIASDYVIEANNAVTNQVWNISIEFVNLDSNQNANLDKNFSAKIYMTTDKMSSYNPIQVTNIEANPTYNTVDTTLSLTNGTAPAEKYYFAIEEADTTTGYINNNNGVVRLNNTLAASDTIEYTEHDDVNYEFTNLKENTEYIIYGYVEDINGIKSNVYSTSITTNEYVLPSVNEVTHSVTLNSITLTVNAENGDGNVVTYMYSKDNGVSWETSASNTYTFNYLNDTTEYKIKVKVVDSNGRESTEYYEAISTETYILPTVANVDYTTAYNSITLTPTGTEGTNLIDHYEYSINNGAYQTSNVFSNLNEQTSYTINVKAVDSAGRESNPYTIEVTTDTYQVPTITNVTTSSTTNSITINVSASNGDGTITKYMYSRDNGSNWYESTSNSYTFSGLTSNTTFYVQVKVVDNNNRESAVSNATIKTQYLNPVVNSVSTSNITTSSITLTVNATPGSNNITTYYYSNNNGSSYVSSTSNTYTFSGLSAGTTYNFKVYVLDSGGIKSNEVTNNATTLYIKPAVNSVTTTNVTNNSITIKVSATAGTNAIKTYYYSINNGSYTSSSSNSHTFSSLSSGTNYSIRVYVIDTNGITSNTKTIYVDTKEVVLAEVCSNGNNLASCLIKYYNSTGDKENGLYHHVASLEYGAGDNSYRYSGANPNNYICFGSTASTCPNDNLYRIIGVFDNQTKLIKADFANQNVLGTTQQNSESPETNTYKGYLDNISTYNWSGSKSNENNNWNNSTLNTKILNGTYLNTFSSTWKNKIATHSWKVGGMSYGNLSNWKGNESEETYSYEVGSNSSNVTYSAKIGLVYVSDYTYAARNNGWSMNMFSYSMTSVRNYNWMFIGGASEWTISRDSDGNTNGAFEIETWGGVFATGGVNLELAVRPVFYLNSNITYTGGSGTESDPIRIN